MNGLSALTATELLEHYRNHELSPVEVTQACLSRMEAWEPHLHATYLLNSDAAIEAAKQSEARWMKNGPCGSLDGVPITSKEHLAMEGLPCPFGTAATVLTPVPSDAPPVARIREAGANILCKTTVPDYLMISSGVSTFHSITRNPWDLTKNPGGSSAGAGAAAAAGYAPLHLGTDIGGSIRLPAGWCGVFGLKPTLGRVPIDPPFPGRVTGPITRTVADAALLMSVLSLPDWRDHMSLPYQQLDWLDLNRGVKGLKLGLWLDAGFGLPVESQVRTAIESAGSAFREAGAVVEEIPPFLNQAMMDGLDQFWRAKFWAEISLLPVERQAKILPFIFQWAKAGESISGAAAANGYNQSLAMAAAANAACNPFDFVLSPVSPVPAFPAELPSPTNDPALPFQHIGFTVALNMSGQPSAAINCSYTTDGLPIGLQITGKRFDDLGVLQLAHFYENVRPTQRPWPEPPTKQ